MSMKGLSLKQRKLWKRLRVLLSHRVQREMCTHSVNPSGFASIGWIQFLVASRICSVSAEFFWFLSVCCPADASAHGHGLSRVPPGEGGGARRVDGRFAAPCWNRRYGPLMERCTRRLLAAGLRAQW